MVESLACLEGRLRFVKVRKEPRLRKEAEGSTFPAMVESLACLASEDEVPEVYV